MFYPQIISGLACKRDEIERTVVLYERKLKEAKRDLAHVNASLRLLKVEGDRSQFSVHMDIHRLFKRGEIVRICKDALAKEEPLDTRELSYRVMKAKELDQRDDMLRQANAYRIVQTLRLQYKRGKVASAGKRKGVRLWHTPTKFEPT